jgi:branched-chain amino acid transport system permease protein
MTGSPSSSIFLQILINGLFLGCIYGVAAIGLSLIFSSMQIIFIAQGTVMILAAYCIYWMVTLISIDPLFGLLLIIPIFMGLGWTIYMGIFQKVAKSGRNPSLILAFGLMVLLEHLMSLIWNPNTRTVTTSYSTLSFALSGLHISFIRLIIASIGLITTGLVFLFLKKTMLGKAVLGVSEDTDTAAFLGISPSHVSAVTFAIGMALAGVAGVAISMIYPFNPYFGFLFSLKALIAVAFGGLGSVGGALLGGIILGVLESISSYIISTGWTDAITYAIFLIVLVLRPHGLLGCPVNNERWKLLIPAPIIKQNLGSLVYAIIMLSFFFIYPFLVDSETSYSIYFLYMAFLYVTVAQGWNLAAGFTGLSSFGQHAFFGVGCYITAITWKVGWTGYLDPLALLLSGMGAALLAIGIGLPLLTKLRGDYFALGTLGLGEVLRVVAINGGDFTGGAVGISISPSAYLSMRHYYLFALFIMLMTLLFLRFIIQSRIGLAFVSIREDEVAAATNGVNILRHKIFAFATGAFFTGLCGSLSAYHMFHIHPSGAFSINWVLMPILMTLLGGTGTFWGPVLGAFIMTAVFELTNMWVPELHGILSSAFIFLITLFFPYGIITYIMGQKSGVLRKSSSFKWWVQKT